MRAVEQPTGDCGEEWHSGLLGGEVSQRPEQFFLDRLHQRTVKGIFHRQSPTKDASGLKASGQMFDGLGSPGQCQRGRAVDGGDGDRLLVVIDPISKFVAGQSDREHRPLR